MKVTREMKKLIGSKIKKHNMKHVIYSNKNAMVAIPETEDVSGKPLFISCIQFNKIHDFVTRTRQ